MLTEETSLDLLRLEKRRAEIEKDLKLLQELEKHRTFRRYQEELAKMGKRVVYSKDLKETLKFYDEKIQEKQQHYNDINIYHPGWNDSNDANNEKAVKEESPLNLKDIKESLKGLDDEIQDMKNRDLVNYGMNYSWHSPVETQDGFFKRAIRCLFQRVRQKE